jgi:DNA repair ATPase RecN
LTSSKKGATIKAQKGQSSKKERGSYIMIRGKVNILGAMADELDACATMLESDATYELLTTEYNRLSNMENLSSNQYEYMDYFNNLLALDEETDYILQSFKTLEDMENFVYDLSQFFCQYWLDEFNEELPL